MTETERIKAEVLEERKQEQERQQKEDEHIKELIREVVNESTGGGDPYQKVINKYKKG